MTDYLRYYLPVALQLLVAWSFYVGGPWVYAAALSFPVLMIIDVLLPRDYAPRKIRSEAWASVPLWISVLLGPALYFVLAWRVGQGDMTGLQVAASIVGIAWLSVVPIVPVTHELYHQRGVLAPFVARCAQICYFDCTRDIAHVVGHHIDVATTRDSDTAIRGVDLYRFTVRAVWESTECSFRTDCDALARRGKGRWSLGHRVYKAILAQVLMQSVIYLIGGWKAVTVALAGMFIARIWAESFNYFQHYGLVRVIGSPIGKRHVWNHLNTLSRIFGWEITNHADHHLDAYKPYYALVPDQTAYPMPSVFVCFLTALIPPLWQNMIAKPALKDWDLNRATADERKLARAQNLAAGWPDWFAEGPVAEPQLAT